MMMCSALRQNVDFVIKTAWSQKCDVLKQRRRPESCLRWAVDARTLLPEVKSLLGIVSGEHQHLDVVLSAGDRQVLKV